MPVHFGLAIKNFVGPTETPDIDELYRYSARAEALGFDPEHKRMRLEAVHPGVSVKQVREHTGFELLLASPVATTTPPTDDELTMLRALDPERRFLG